MFKAVMTVCYLSLNCITDLKKRQVHGLLGIMFGIVGIVINICTEIDWKQIIFGVAVTQILALIAWITKEAIGYGDVLCIFACSMWIKPEGVILLMLIGFFLSALVSLTLIVIKKKSRYDRIPFVPFLLFGFLGQLMIMG